MNQSPELKQFIKDKQKKQIALNKFITKSHERLQTEHRKLLKLRGINNQIIDKFKIGYCPEINKKQIKNIKNEHPKKYEEYKLIGLIGKGDYFLASNRIVLRFPH
ncbi:MAG: hypothetical protein ACOCRO_07100 [Halanaerobiales bacterium]